MRRLDTYDQWLNEEVKSRLGFKDESAIAKHLTKEQIDWCNKHIKVPWSVNDKGEVTVVDDLGFKSKSMIKRFPVQFAPVKGNFDCSSCPNLASLEGAPAHVGGDFWCYNCPKLTSLEGAPAHVGRDFYCNDCPIVSLESAPAHVERGFSCSDCSDLTSLEGAPAHVGGNFSCSRCPIVSLEGAPAHVGRDFRCDDCPKLPVSFEGIIEDYNEERIDWKLAHKLIHNETARKAHSIGLI